MTGMSLLLLIALAPSGFDDAALAARVKEISAESRGRLGVAVKDLSTGQTWSLRGGERFPMQSVFKLPLGIAALRLEELKEVDLDEKIRITEKDLSPPWSLINRRWKGPTSYSLRDLTELAVITSDNSAADILMRRLGGPARVTSVLRELGVQGIRIDRYERVFQPEASGLGSYQTGWHKQEAWDSARSTVSLENRVAAMTAYLKDPRDTSTPLGMLGLLSDLQTGRLLSRSNTVWILDVMTRTTTGATRLKAAMPAGASLAHKTGTGGDAGMVNAASNDVGIITMPDGRRVAVVVFLTGSRAPEADREKVIADVGRAVISAMKRG